MSRKITHANNATSLELRLPKYLHWGVSVLTFFYFWLRFRYPTGEWHVTNAFRYDIFVSLGFGLLLAWFFKTYNAYTLGYFRIRALAFLNFWGRFSALLSSKGAYVVTENVQNILKMSRT